MEALRLDLEASSTSATAAPAIRWFSSIGSVVVRGTHSSVFIGGLLLGEFDEAEEDRGRRNVLAVTLAKAGLQS